MSAPSGDKPADIRGNPLREAEDQTPAGILGGMTHPLHSLFPQSSVSPVQAAAAPPPATQAIAAELVERILVNAPADGPQEIRLFLHQDVLAGTEIHIRRDADGLLGVRVCTDNATSLQTIVSARDTLQQALERTENSLVHLEIVDADRQDAQQNDHHRRSRGYQEYHPEDSD